MVLRRGFSLFAVLVSIAMVGALAAIGFNLYVAAATRSERAEASATLSALASAEEEYAADHHRYAATFDELRFKPKGKFTRIGPADLEVNRYVFSLSELAGSWLCTATANLDDDEWPDQLIAAPRAQVVYDDLTDSHNPLELRRANHAGTGTGRVSAGE